MKYLLIALMILVSGCTSETKHGKCIGLDDEKDPKLVYDISTKNVILAALFSELAFIPPIVVLLTETYCPTGIK